MRKLTLREDKSLAQGGTAAKVLAEETLLLLTNQFPFPSRQSVGKLWFTRQIQPATCFSQQSLFGMQLHPLISL